MICDCSGFRRSSRLRFRVEIGSIFDFSFLLRIDFTHNLDFAIALELSFHNFGVAHDYGSKSTVTKEARGDALEITGRYRAQRAHLFSH